MAYYKIDKVFKYTETVYVKADSVEQAKSDAGSIDGEHNNDDTWHDAGGEEITEDEYLSVMGN